MTSAQHPNRVYFSSLDRSPVDSNTDFTITFDTPIERAKNFEVVTASFPNTFHQFAPYETVLYFYHELFFGGTIAIGIPMSITLFSEGGATGENAIPSSRPAGRQEYIDGRYFLDGEDLQDYLNDWIQSLSSSWPTQASGLRPFYHANDDPTAPVTYVASEVASGITFSALSFDYDTTTNAGGRGSLKFTFSDSGGNDVRIASVVDYGILRQDWIYPSQLGFKMGYTDLVQEAFGDVANITSANNQFSITFTNGITQYLIDTTNNTYSLRLTLASDSTEIDVVYTIPNGTYTFSGLLTALNSATTTSTNQSNVNWYNVGSNIGANCNFFGSKSGTQYFIDTSYGGSQLYNLIAFPKIVTIGTSSGIPVETAGYGSSSPAVPNIIPTVYTEDYTIAIADYTATALASAIQTALRTQNTGTPTYTYVGSTTTVTASANKLTFTFTSSTSGLPVELVFDSGTVGQATKTTLGFVGNVTSSTTGSTITAPNTITFEGAISPASHLASDPINLIRTSNIYFASSLSGGEALSSAGRKDILFSVPLTAPVGSVQLYQSTLSGIVVNRPPDVLRNLRVTLLDDNFQTMEQLPQNASIAVEIHFAYQDDNQVNNVSTIVRY
jgi:hypothetical protein